MKDVVEVAEPSEDRLEANFKKFLELNPGKNVKDFRKLQERVGWNGMLGEMAEERLGEIARGVAYEVGIEDEGFIYKLHTMEQL